MHVDIIIPSLKEIDVLLVHKIASTRKTEGLILFTSQKACSSINRNYGLNKATSTIVIMVDDDIEGFFPGWDEELCKPFLTNPEIYLVSARLKKRDGNWSPMIGNVKEYSQPIVYTPKKIIPSSSIAFYKDGIRFDENYQGSGYEDTDFCLQKKNKYPNGKVAINNKCILIHNNEQKNQKKYVETNKAYFIKKWDISDIMSYTNDGNF